MIQRKQTVFLLLAFISTLVCLFLPLGTFEPVGMGVGSMMYNIRISGNGVSDFSVCVLFVLLLLSSILSVWTIFMYGNRKRQIALCGVDMLLVVVWYACFAFFANSAGVEGSKFHVSFASCLPFVALILIVMARRGIIHDEKLVRAADRIR